MKSRHEAMMEVSIIVQKMLSANYGIESLIAGGFPRDIGMGKPELVNDVDMVIHNDETVASNAEDMLDEITKILSRRPWISQIGFELFLEYGDDFASEQSGDFLDESQASKMDDDFKERIELVMRLMVVTTVEFGDHDFNIDILMSIMGESEPLTSFLDTFDFSINRWIIKPNTKKAVYVPVAPDCGDGEVFRLPGFTSGWRMAYRIAHLRKKYPELDWSNCTRTFDEYIKPHSQIGKERSTSDQKELPDGNSSQK